MIIKSFTAESTSSALKKVREGMGRDAIVLRTRQLQAGPNRHAVEITACIDRPMAANSMVLTPDTPSPIVSNGKSRPGGPLAKSPGAAASTANSQADSAGRGSGSKIEEINRKLDRLLKWRFQMDSGQKWFGVFQQVYERLKDSDFPDQFLESFMTAVIEEYDQSADTMTFARKRLAEQLSSLIMPGLSFKPGDRLLFLGPVGAGKSSVMGKLATRFVAQEKQKVHLASLDYSRIAAHDELAVCAEILGIDVSDSLVDMAASGSGGDDGITLIDAPSLPMELDKLEGLGQQIEQINPDYRFAVFSALTRSADIEALAERLKPLGPTHVVVTMLDQTRRYGSIAVAATALGIKVAFVTNSPGGTGRIIAPDADILAHASLQAGVSYE